MTRNLLDIDDLTPSELAAVLDLAGDEHPPHVLAGRGVALVFQKPSARTRSSSELAVFQLGGHPLTIRADEVGIDERESAEDVARTLAQYHAAIGARVLDHEVLVRMSSVVDVPVINLLSDRAHPLQAIGDLITLRSQWGGYLAGHRLAWVGDANNVARSLALACAMAGVDVTMASPPSHRLDQSTVDAVSALGGNLVQTSSARRGGEGSRRGVHRRLGLDGPGTGGCGAPKAAFAPYQVGASLMSLGAPGAVFLHCLPAHRGEEVAAEVIDGPASVVWPQAANRLRAMRAVLLWLFS